MSLSQKEIVKILGLDVVYQTRAFLFNPLGLWPREILDSYYQLYYKHN